MWNKITATIVTIIVDRIIAAVVAWFKRKTEERKTNEEVKKKVKRLREARSEEEIRDAINNINL